MDEKPDHVGGAQPSPRRGGKSGQSARPPVKVRVVWGDLTELEADVHAVGHYMGVLPTSAEYALDRAISGPDPARQIIAEHTRRQWFLGEFGHVNYFPPVAESRVKIAALAGMGRLGTFSENRATQLAENLLLELCALGHADHVAMVAIGSGAQNLSIDRAARALADGFAKALESTRMRHGCTQISLVEFDRLRAQRLHEAFVAAAKPHDQLAVDGALQPAKGGGVGFHSAVVYAIGSVVNAAKGTDSAGLESLLGLGTEPALAAMVVTQLSEGDSVELLRSAELVLRDVAGKNPPPTRISVLESSRGGIRVAGITGTATVPERQIDADPRLIDEIIRRMNPPSPGRLQQLSELMSRLVLPGDLRSLVSPVFPLVFEVDRRTAQIHWELVADLIGATAMNGETQLPLVLQQSVSRQLRTAYSSAPALDVGGSKELRVLVIGDPGGSKAALPGARKEALAIHYQLQQFKELGVEVTTLIGAPDTTKQRGFEPAARLDVLERLLSGDYQIVHYCGHGTFDPQDQRRAGWYFADGLLTSRELAQLVGTPPRLVVANACFSSQLGVFGSSSAGRTTPGSPATGAGGAPDGDRSGDDPAGAQEALLTPSLADEFLRAGVSNYIGAAWPVEDEDAVLFSTTLYQRLLEGQDTLGAAVTEARRSVWNKYPAATPPGERGTTWVAYQHYGDPSERL